MALLYFKEYLNFYDNKLGKQWKQTFFSNLGQFNHIRLYPGQCARLTHSLTFILHSSFNACAQNCNSGLEQF